MNEVRNATHEEKHDLLPEDGPPDDIYWKVVPIWSGQSHDDLAARFGDEYPCAYALGFEEGIVMAMLRPEWAQGLYHAVRQHYLSTHTEEDLEDWQSHAEQTAHAMPIERTLRRLQKEVANFGRVI